MAVQSGVVFPGNVVSDHGQDGGRVLPPARCGQIQFAHSTVPESSEKIGQCEAEWMVVVEGSR